MARRAEEVSTQALHWLDKNEDRPFFLFMNFIDAHTPYLPVEEDDEEAAAAVGEVVCDIHCIQSGMHDGVLIIPPSAMPSGVSLCQHNGHSS